MKFGVFYEHALPRPWSDGAEQKLFQDALTQVELADRVGLDYVWEVEHHFLEEYSHSSAPEVFLAACSQRTRNIRLGHGVMLMAPSYNHPARAAERIATLDLVSGGRVDWGTGESGSAMEMGGFEINPDLKTAMWREGVEQAANMLAMTPYPGFRGEHFSMPTRNIVPKPVQKPHPPIWMACSRRETIHRAARNGLGALAFAFIDPKQAAVWIKEYYDIIKSDECVPLGHTVNANVALVSGMSLHADEDEAVRRGLEGFQFFGYAVGYYANYGQHVPGRTDLWGKFSSIRDTLEDNAGRGGIGTPDQLRKYLAEYEDIGLDQMIFVQQSGRTAHEHICESLEIFGAQVLPAFKARQAEAERKKQLALAPYIAAALKRKKRMPAIADGQIPIVNSFGVAKALSSDQQKAIDGFSDRGGAISVPRIDPHTVAKRTKV